MGNKCGAFLQSCPDAPVLHVEKLSIWTGSEVSGAQGKLWDKRLAGRDEWGWSGRREQGEERLRNGILTWCSKARRRKHLNVWTNWSGDKLWGEFRVKLEAKKLCRACQLDCMGNGKLLTAKVELNSSDFLYYLYSALSLRFFSVRNLFCSHGSLVIWFYVFSHDGSMAGGDNVEWMHMTFGSITPFSVTKSLK